VASYPGGFKLAASLISGEGLAILTTPSPPPAGDVTYFFKRLEIK